MAKFVLLNGLALGAREGMLHSPYTLKALAIVAIADLSLLSDELT
jgi:hypothetical protein